MIMEIGGCIGIVISVDRYQAINLVARGSKSSELETVELGPLHSEAHLSLMGNSKCYSSPCLSSPNVFEAGICSKTNQDKLGPDLLCPNLHRCIP